MRRRIPVAGSAVLEKFQSNRVIRSMAVSFFLVVLMVRRLSDWISY